MNLRLSLSSEYYHFLIIEIFYPTGEPISQHRLHCSSFVVVHYNFMSHFFAATATSVRE
jgi:hypothetical protein